MRITTTLPSLLSPPLLSLLLLSICPSCLSTSLLLFVIYYLISLYSTILSTISSFIPSLISLLVLSYVPSIIQFIIPFLPSFLPSLPNFLIFSLIPSFFLPSFRHSIIPLIIFKWWAAYLESVDRLDKAKRYYKKAGDHLALVRICCFQVRA